MVVDILRRFVPAIAALDAELDVRRIGMIEAQDHCRRLIAENNRLMDELHMSQAREREARDQVADWLATRLTGKPIYGNGLNLAEINEPSPEQIQAALAPRRRRARDIAREMEQKFYAAAGVASQPFTEADNNGADPVPN